MRDLICDAITCCG